MTPDAAAPDGAHPTDLATRQADLIRALVANGPTPPGFTPDDLTPTATALLRKRAGLVAKRYPLLAQQAGPDFPDKFITWAKGRPSTSVADDAAAFAAANGLHQKRGWFRR
ncbi:hypothetical protein [Nocardia harenae]|uniref:hypothetical protein n=1 Tax=Nocardia harenae TaxID=358707 RepID=UPI0008328569|nr:hypothetical protein [Nocardia harenae]